MVEYVIITGAVATTLIVGINEFQPAMETAYAKVEDKVEEVGTMIDSGQPTPQQQTPPPAPTSHSGMTPQQLEQHLQNGPHSYTVTQGPGQPNLCSICGQPQP